MYLGEECTTSHDMSHDLMRKHINKIDTVVVPQLVKVTVNSEKKMKA